uniref:SWIM-type domain-containing protein n=1 Tax=Lactuca sativa TaxID=4236 RepID=A0A9R1WKZ2_LACSA|nr:hypothetical protein LSAT_V11C100036340 [Lactuca sativa]
MASLKVLMLCQEEAHNNHVRGVKIINDGQNRHYHVLPSGLNQFEVRGATDAYEVDLERKTCSCRLWQLNGYGCAHSIASVSYLNRDVEAYVDNMFSTTTFRKAYNYIISPMNGSDMWPETNCTPPLPPISRRMHGRPATKRKKSTIENTGTHKVSKVGKKIRCNRSQQDHLSIEKAPKVKCEETESFCEAKCRTGKTI